MTAAEAALAAVRDALDGRRLVWFGIRGEDGEALLELPELDASFSIIAPLRSASIRPESNVCLEDISGRRLDLDRPDVDRDVDHGIAAEEFRERLLREVSGRCVLMTYRPSTLTSALAFAMSETMTLAGMYRERQLAFEHKPWVERSLERRGVRGLDWRYVADEHRSRARRMVRGGPHILRATRTSGGVGVALVTTEEEVDRHWPHDSDSFAALSPYLDPAIPLNVTGCVFADGGLRVHPPSIQLIGVESCTDRRFGYCGNDFGPIADLGDDVLAQLDAMVRTVGRWLYDERYVGVFGLDALVYRGKVHFTEINARFQGSSALSAEIASQLDLPDVYLDHLAATLGISPSGPELSLADWAQRQPAVAQIVLHNTTAADARRDETRALPGRRDGVRLAQVPRAVEIEPGAALCRVTMARSVTRTGFEIDDDSARLVAGLLEAFGPALAACHSEHAPGEQGPIL